MKKIVLLLSLLIILNFYFIQGQNSDEEKTIVNQEKKRKFSLSLGAGIRTISGDEYREIYGGTNITFSADLGFRIWKSVELFLHTDILSLKGETTYTKEETTFKLTPIECGLRFLMGKKKILPWMN